MYIILYCAADFCVAHALLLLLLLLLPRGRRVRGRGGGVTPFYGTAFVRRSPGDARSAYTAAVGSFGILARVPATPLRQWVFPSLFNPTAAAAPTRYHHTLSPRAAVFPGALVVYLSRAAPMPPRSHFRHLRNFHPLLPYGGVGGVYIIISLSAEANTPSALILIIIYNIYIYIVPTGKHSRARAHNTYAYVTENEVLFPFFLLIYTCLRFCARRAEAVRIQKEKRFR